MSQKWIKKFFFYLLMKSSAAEVLFVRTLIYVVTLLQSNSKIFYRVEISVKQMVLASP